jgi:integrase/recombinase XerD
MARSDPVSVLEQHLDEYLRLRRTLGHKLAHAHRYLPRFVSYLDEHGTEFVTIQAALAWSLERAVPVGSVVPADRMMVVRGFARYLSGIDPRTEVPPAGAIRHPQRWRRPFIYSENDVLAIIDQADRRIGQPLRSATYQTLIGLLATTGLRVGEALRLDRSDLDRSEGVLRIRESKFGKSRLVPLQASAVDALERYDHTRQRLHLRVRVADASRALRARRGRGRLAGDPEDSRPQALVRGQDSARLVSGRG